VIVECAVGVGDVETVVSGVEGVVEVFVQVHGAVEEVLPGIYYADCGCELQGGDDEVVDRVAGLEFPGCEGWCKCRLAVEDRRCEETWVDAASYCRAESRVGSA